MTIPEKAVIWAVNVAKENKSGYDQISRWGSPDYDCSSFVISAYRAAGVDIDINNVSYTGNMTRMVNYGFKKMSLDEAKPYQPGDIFVAHNSKHQHTIMYIGDGNIVQASINEKGTATGGKPGDQTGNEINIRNYYIPSGGWNYILRYEVEEMFTYEEFEEYMKRYNKKLADKGVPALETNWIHQAHKFVTENDLSDGFRPFSFVTRAEAWGMMKNFYVFISKLIMRGK